MGGIESLTDSAVSPRRRNMQANRRRDTAPERALRSALHATGLRYRCDLRIDLPGGRVRPDIAFTRKRIAVFVDGCFWHCCPVHGRAPSVNTSYWSPKLARNRERDLENTKALEAAGWQVVRIWEHQGTSEALETVLEAVARFTDASTL
jgi:DNA mismatch endonuclease (patch repair protein)